MPDPKFDQLPPDLSRLHKLLVDYFDLDGIRTLCFDLSVRYDDLRGETITAKVVALLQHLDRIKRIEVLLEYAERKRPNVDWRGGPLPEAICPYKGLHAFGEADKDNFFGRDEFTKKLVAAVNKQSLVAVVGPSGSGKSSVVFAGLLPALDRVGSWLVVNFRPGNDPFLNLAKALVPLIEPTTSKLKIPVVARQKLKPFLGGENKAERIPLADYLQQIQEDHPDQKLLLIIDQFEELYTQVEQAMRRDFLDVLLAAGFGQSALATPTRTFATLLLTMRADFMGQALAYPPMVTALQDNDVKIGLMSRDELALAIEQPALNQSVRFADGLVTRILEDVGDHAGNLPLLEFALTLLWDRQTNRQMTHDAYEAIGGVSGALAQHADETLAKLTQNDMEKIQAIQRVMVQLVQPGAGAEDTRRVARRADLGDAGWTLAQRLAAEDARLLVTGRDSEDAETTETVEVIHEALIQNWGQLQEWMEQDREFRMWQERLRSDLALWQKNEKQKGYLLQGAPLTLAEEWLERRRDDLNPLEVEFIEASLQKRKGDNFRRIGTAVLVAALLIGASIIVAIIQSQAATDIGIEATKGAIAQVTAVAAAATSDHNEGVALTREVEAEQSAAVAATARAEEAERAIEANARYLMTQAQVVFEDDPQLGLILALESLALADEIGEAEAILEEINGRNTIFQWGRQHALGNNFEELFFNYPSILVFDYKDRDDELWEISTNKIVTLTLPESDIVDVKFDPTKRFVVVIYLDINSDLLSKIYDLETKQHPDFIADIPVETVSFDATGRYIIVTYQDANNDSYSEIYNLETEQLLFQIADGYIENVDYGYNSNSGYINEYFIILSTRRTNGISSVIYEVSNQKALDFVSEGLIDSVVFDNTGRYMSVRYGEYTRNGQYSIRLELYDLQTEQKLDLAKFENVNSENLYDVDLNIENGIMAVYYNFSYRTTSGGGTFPAIELYDFQSGQELDLIHDGIIRYIDFHGRFLHIEYANEFGDLTHTEIYDVESGQRPNFLTNDLIEDVSFSQSGRYMLLVYLDENGDSYSEIYDVEGGQRPEYLSNINIKDVVLDGTGQYLIVTYLDRNGDQDTTIYDIESGKPPAIEAVDIVGRYLVVRPDRHIMSYEMYDIVTGQRPDFLADDLIIEVRFSANNRFLSIEYGESGGNFYWEIYDLNIKQQPEYITDERLRSVNLEVEDRYLIITNEFGDQKTAYDVISGMKIAQNIDLNLYSIADNQFVIVEAGGNFDIWRVELTSTTHLVSLGTNIGRTVYIDPLHRLLVGSVFLNLDWLEAMRGAVETLHLSELVQLACQYPLDNGAVLDKPEVRAALEPYLEKVGLEAPQACQTVP